MMKALVCCRGVTPKWSAWRAPVFPEGSPEQVRAVGVLCSRGLSVTVAAPSEVGRWVSCSESVGA